MAQPLTEENINYTYDRVVQRRGTVQIVAACLQNDDLEGLHRERHALEWEIGRAMGWFDGLPRRREPAVWARYAALIDTLLLEGLSNHSQGRAA